MSENVSKRPDPIQLSVAGFRPEPTNNGTAISKRPEPLRQSSNGIPVIHWFPKWFPRSKK